jgi:hypothetical protein
MQGASEQCMQATEIDFLAGHAVVEGDHAAAVHAPGHLVLVLAGGDAAVAFDAALASQMNFILAIVFPSSLLDLADRGLGFLHHRHAS